jgi:glucokinase
MYFLADVGGTKTRFALASKSDCFDRVIIYPTISSYRKFLIFLENFIKSNLRSSERIKKMVFGFAGMLNKEKEKLVFSPNLKNFENKNLKNDLKNIFRAEIVLENDALLAGLGEGKFGAGKTFDTFGYLTLSTGIGGAKINNADNNQIINKFSFSEPGHSFLLIDNFLFEVEELLGGESIKKIFGKKPEEINGRLFDLKAEKFWNYYHEILSIFLINISIFWSVEKIILGGGISKRLNFRRLNLLINKLNPLPTKIKIIKSKLGELNVLYGALVIVSS